MTDKLKTARIFTFIPVALVIVLFAMGFLVLENAVSFRGLKLDAVASLVFRLFFILPLPCLVSSLTGKLMADKALKNKAEGAEKVSKSAYVVTVLSVIYIIGAACVYLFLFKIVGI